MIRGGQRIAARKKDLTADQQDAIQEIIDSHTRRRRRRRNKQKTPPGGTPQQGDWANASPPPTPDLDMEINPSAAGPESMDSFPYVSPPRSPTPTPEAQTNLTPSQESQLFLSQATISRLLGQVSGEVFCRAEDDSMQGDNNNTSYMPHYHGEPQ